MERQLAKQTELYNEQLARSTKLQVDYNKVSNDYHAQLEVRVVLFTNQPSDLNQQAYLVSFRMEM